MIAVGFWLLAWVAVSVWSVTVYAWIASRRKRRTAPQVMPQDDVDIEFRRLTAELGEGFDTSPWLDGWPIEGEDAR